MRVLSVLACIAVLTAVSACETQPQGTTTSQQGDVVFSGGQYK